LLDPGVDERHSKQEASSMTLSLTEYGERIQLDGMAPEIILIVEVMKCIKHVHEDDLPRILDGLVAEFGTVENAVEAVKSGMVEFEED
jgi:hypothetical protein